MGPAGEQEDPKAAFGQAVKALLGALAPLLGVSKFPVLIPASC